MYSCLHKYNCYIFNNCILVIILFLNGFEVIAIGVKFIVLNFDDIKMKLTFDKYSSTLG